MSTIFSEDFETGSLAAGGWSYGNSANAVTALGDQSPILENQHSFHQDGWQPWCYKYIGTQGEIYGQFLYWQGRTNECAIFELKVGSTFCLVISADNTRKLYAYYGAAATKYATSAACLNLSGINVIDFYYKPHSSTGRLTVKVNNVTVIDYTGRTVPGTETTIDVFQFGTVGGLYYVGQIVDALKLGTTWYPFPYAAGTNKFINDADCVAAYRFEAQNDAVGNIQTTNDIPGPAPGGAVLSMLQGPNIPLYLTVQEGLAGAIGGGGGTNQAYGSIFGITDANMPAGFPLKSGDSVKKISSTFWFTPLTLPNAGAKGDIHGKSYYYGSHNPNSFTFSVNNTGLLIFNWFDSSGNPVPTNLQTLTVNQKYHIGYAIDGVNKTVLIRVWDDVAQTATTYNITPAVVMYMNSNPLSMGGINYSTAYNYCHGAFDEWAIFKDLITVDEIDQIRSGVYGLLQHPANSASATTCNSPTLYTACIPATNRSATTCHAGMVITVATPATNVSICSCSQAGTEGMLVNIPSANSITTMQETRLETIIFPASCRSLSTASGVWVMGILFPEPFTGPQLRAGADRAHIDGVIDVGYHKVAISWYDSDTEEESPLSLPSLMIQNTLLYRKTEVYQPFDTADQPMGNSLRPSTATHWKVYMTPAHDITDVFNDFKFVAQVAISVTNYLINMADSDLGALYSPQPRGSLTTCGSPVGLFDLLIPDKYESLTTMGSPLLKIASTPGAFFLVL